jgi:hypothetical protein
LVLHISGADGARFSRSCSSNKFDNWADWAGSAHVRDSHWNRVFSSDLEIFSVVFSVSQARDLRGLLNSIHIFEWGENSVWETNSTIVDTIVPSEAERIESSQGCVFSQVNRSVWSNASDALSWHNNTVTSNISCDDSENVLVSIGKTSSSKHSAVELAEVVCATANLLSGSLAAESRSSIDVSAKLLDSDNVALDWRSTILKRGIPSKRDRVNVSISALEVENSWWNTWENSSVVDIRGNGHTNHILTNDSGINAITRDHLELVTSEQGRRNSANAWADISLNIGEAVVNDIRGLSAGRSHISVLEDSLLEAIDVLEGFILDGNSAASHWPVSLALLVAHIPSDSNSSVVTSQGSQDVLGLEWNSSSLDLKISGGHRETDSVEGLASKDVRNTISKTSDGGLSAGEGSSRVHIIRADGNLVH